MNKAIICNYRSWYHFLGLCSFLESQESKITNIILLQDYIFFNKQTANTEKLKKYCNTVDIVNSQQELIEMVSDRNYDEIFLVTPSPLPYGLKRKLNKRKQNFKLIVIEEGIGTYGSFLSTLRAVVRENSNRSIIKIWKKVITFTTKHFLKKIYFIDQPKYYWTNFDLKTGAINNEVVEAYKRALDWLSIDYCFDNSTNTSSEKYVVIATSPFVELGLMDADEYINVISSIRNSIPSEARLLIKPHPIEDKKKYLRFEVIESMIPLEAMIHNCSNKIISVYGFSSTTLYTTALFIGIPTFYIKEHDKFSKSLSENQKNIINKVSKVH